MPSWTERLARACSRRPWIVVGAWVVAFAAAMASVAAFLPTALESDRIVYGTDSRQGSVLLEERFPEPAGPDELVVVRSENETVDDPEFREEVERLTREIEATGVARATNVYRDREQALVTDDRSATTIAVSMTGEDEAANEDNIVKVVDVVDAAVERSSLDISMVGEFTLDHDRGYLAERDLQKGEFFFGLPIALVILVLVFGALVGAFVPLLVAIMSIVVTVAIVAVSGQVHQHSLFIVNMVTGMGLALGIDYSLFVVTRYREERSRGHEKLEAIARAGATSSRAVFFSGLVFVIALLSMLLIPDSILRSLALGAVLVGAVSVLAALTFLPALLGLLGDRVNSLRVPILGRALGGTGATEGRFWSRIVQAVMRRPVVSVVLATALLVAATVPVLGLQVRETGLTDFPDYLLSKRGFDALNEEFPGATADPVEIVVDGAVETAPVQEAIDRLESAVERHGLLGQPTREVNDAGDLALISVPIAGDAQSGQAMDTVRELRRDQIPAAFSGVDADVYITGTSADTLDASDVSSRWLPIVIAFVLALSFVLLTIAFRSLVVPLKAILLNLLSVGAAYGLLTLVIQEGVGADFLGFEQVESVTSWVPVFLFAVLFGLSMDYHVFLLSRIRERYGETGRNEEAVVYGVSTTARLITGAALIMVAVFTGFAIGDLPMFQQLGFGLAVALLIDATIIRSVLLPASMKLLGDRNWYLPSWLEWLPHVSVEGEAPRRAAAEPTS